MDSLAYYSSCDSLIIRMDPSVTLCDPLYVVGFLGEATVNLRRRLVSHHGFFMASRALSHEGPRILEGRGPGRVRMG